MSTDPKSRAASGLWGPAAELEEIWGQYLGLMKSGEQWLTTSGAAPVSSFAFVRLAEPEPTYIVHFPEVLCNGTRVLFNDINPFHDPGKTTKPIAMGAAEVGVVSGIISHEFPDLRVRKLEVTFRLPIYVGDMAKIRFFPQESKKLLHVYGVEILTPSGKSAARGSVTLVKV